MDWTLQACKDAGGDFDADAKKCFAKIIYSFDVGHTIDRTKKSHPHGKFDIDFRDLHAENPLAKKWSYGGSSRNIEKARENATSIQAVGTKVQIRIVDAKTGEILEWQGQ